MPTIAGAFSKRIKAAERRRRTADNSWDADAAFCQELDLFSAMFAVGEITPSVDGRAFGLGFANLPEVPRPVNAITFADESALAWSEDGLDLSAVSVIRGGAGKVRAAENQQSLGV